MKRLSVVGALALAAAASSGLSAAAPERPIHVVVFVDVIPTDMAAGSALLATFVRQARRDRALRSIMLVEQTTMPNHFILDETFATSADYSSFEQRGYVRAFRNALFPHLGSPWDERSGREVST